MGKIKLILGASILLFSSTSNASIWEYSISGNAYWLDESSVGITGMAFIDDEKTPYYTLGDSNCPPGPFHYSCDTQFNFTYFDMDVGDEYNFAGTSGYIKNTSSDTYGELVGTGDWSYMYHSTDAGYIAPILNYEEWLAFELPTLISWEAGLPTGQLIAINSLLVDKIFIMSVSMEKIGLAPISEPPTILLFGIGLIGLAGFSKRGKTA